jgi:putative redox protein
MVRIEWKGGMAFTATPPSGRAFTMDAIPDFGGHDLGPTPLEAFLGALGACAAMDVISVLQKKQQSVTGYRIEVEGTRDPEGSPWPRPYKSLTVRHILTGENIDPAAVQRAVQLSDDKYCTVISTLRESPEVTSVWEIAD